MKSGIYKIRTALRNSPDSDHKITFNYGVYKTYKKLTIDIVNDSRAFTIDELKVYDESMAT